MTDVLGRLTAALADRYAIERELGAGGMATVYLAHDVRHGRKVALKVLRPELAAILGGERFLAEIKTTASLQHPHILPLHDSGEADGLVFYVMPYVEGESLRDRLTREKQLQVDEAVRLATEVASALDYAHRHGVVHRDIKPENVLLHEGQALVADFGIALAASRSEGGTRLTETGMSLGTPHYMAPEQAMGEREITPKADVYALGCVLYEMLTGEPPFTGPTAQAIIARVMTEAPRPIALQRHTVPPHVEAAVLTALEKLPADRFASAAQFAEAVVGHGLALQPTRATAGATVAVGAAPWRGRFQVAAGVALAALVAAAWGWARAGGASHRPVEREHITLGDSASLFVGAPALALSPDGSTLAFKDSRPNGMLWLKRDDDLDPEPIPGTDRAYAPVFSPDGRWIAFVADGRLRKVPARGGAAVTIADSAGEGTLGGAAWLADGTLVYAPTSLQGLRRVSASGGASQVALSGVVLNGGGVGAPEALPGSRGVLFQYCNSGCTTMSVHVLDLRAGTEKRLLDDVAQAWYLPGGRLLYVRGDGVALVAPFDLGRLEITGSAVPVLGDVYVAGGFAQLVWSANGTLVYARGAGAAQENVVVRANRGGIALPVDTAWRGPLNSLALSPDGRRLAVGLGATTGGLNVWIKELDRGPFTRLSFGGEDRRPAWSPDGRWVAFVRDTGATSIVVARPADGSGRERALARLDRRIQEVEWSRDGRWLILRTDNGQIGAGDIVGLRTIGDTTPVPLVASRFTELHPALSPDGRWLAYTSNESGTDEVYVRPFPNTNDGRWQVSNGGGAQPRWSADGRAIFFLDAGNRLVEGQIRAAPSFAVTGLHPLFTAAPFQINAFHQSFAVSHDGRFFYFLSPGLEGQSAQGPQLVRVANWLADVAAKVKGNR
jgi:Tol biopolymer transport system component